MPRELFHIKDFTKGTVTAVEETDQSPEAAKASVNLDPTYHGGLRGRKGDELLDTLLDLDGLRAAHAMYSAEGDLEFTTLLGAEHQDGTPTAGADCLTFGTGYQALKSIIERRGELIPAVTNVRVCGADSGGNDLVYFGGKDYANDDVVTTAEVPLPDAGLASPGASTVASGGQLAAGKYFYRRSFLYDGLQDGPLDDAVTVVTTGTESYNAIPFPDLKAYPSLRVRATAMRVWRGFSTDTAAEMSDTPYYLIATVDRSKTDYPAARSGVADTIVQTDGTTITVYDNGADQVGDEYENIAGISSAATSSFVQYRIGYLFQNTMFVGHCTKEGVTEAEFMLFRSLVSRPDTFDWANEYLRLPYIPTAITGYEGRLFVFSDRHVFRINPIGFYIEDQIEQAGTYSPRSVLSLDGGLVFANAVGAYLYNGRELKELTTNIGPTWRAWASSDIQAIYLPECMAVMFLKTGMSPSAWVYSFGTGRWDYWTFRALASATNEEVVIASPGAYVDADGDPNIILEGRFDPLGHPTQTYTRVYMIATDESNRYAWSWDGPLTGLGEPEIEKKLYDTLVDAAGTSAVVTYVTEGTDLHSARGFKRIAFSATGAGADQVRSIGVLFRRMEGKR